VASTIFAKLGDSGLSVEAIIQVAALIPIHAGTCCTSNDTDVPQEGTERSRSLLRSLETAATARPATAGWRTNRPSGRSKRTGHQGALSRSAAPVIMAVAAVRMAAKYVIPIDRAVLLYAIEPRTPSRRAISARPTTGHMPPGTYFPSWPTK